MTKRSFLFPTVLEVTSIKLVPLLLALIMVVASLSLKAQDTLRLKKMVLMLEKADVKKKPPLIEWNRNFIRAVGAEMSSEEVVFVNRWLDAIHRLELKSADLAYDDIEQNINLSYKPATHAKLLLFKADYAYVKLSEEEFLSRLKRLYKYCQNNELSLESTEARNLEGSYWYGKGDFEKASSLFLQNVPIQESLKDTAGLIKSYVNLGSCQNNRGYNNIALRFFQLATNLIDKFPPAFDWKLLVENNIGAVLMSLEDNQAALSHFERLEKRVESLNRPELTEQLLLINLNKSLLSVRLKLFEKAIETRDKIFALKPYWKAYQRDVFFSLCESYILLGNEKESRFWLSEADSLLEKNGKVMLSEYLSLHLKFRKRFSKWAMGAEFRKIWEAQVYKPSDLRYNMNSAEVAARLAKDENRLFDAVKWTDSLANFNNQYSDERLKVLSSEFNLQNKERLFLDSLNALKVHFDKAEAKANFLGNVVIWIVLASILIVLNLTFLFLLSKRKQKSLALESQLERQKAENLELKNRFLSERVEMKQRENGLSENRQEYIQDFKQHILEGIHYLEEARRFISDDQSELKAKIKSKEQQIRNLVIVLNQNENQLKQAEDRNKVSQSWTELLGPLWLEMSETEKDIVRLVREGFTNKEIAEKLEKSQMYVEKLRSRIRKRLNISKEQDLQQFLLAMGAEE